MNEYVIVIVGIIIVAIIMVGGGFTIFNRTEQSEANKFWDCKGIGGSTEYCINEFENDAEHRLDQFKRCQEEINDLNYCHDMFLRHIN